MKERKRREIEKKKKKKKKKKKRDLPLLFVVVDLLLKFMILIVNEINFKCNEIFCATLVV